MKWKFILFRQIQLGLMGLLPMVMGMTCQRDAPRHEPEFIEDQDDIENSTTDPSAIKRPIQGIPNDHTSYLQSWNRLHNPNKKLDDVDLSVILEDISWSDLSDAISWSDLLSNNLPHAKKLGNETLCLNIAPLADPYVQNDFSALIEDQLKIIRCDGTSQSSSAASNRLPNRLCILFKRNGKHGAWNGPKLVDTASITLRSNPVSPNSAKHSFSLIGFLVHIPENNNSKAHLVAFLQLGQNWFYYQNNGSKTELDTEQAMRLASKSGTTFFYRKIT